MRIGVVILMVTWRAAGTDWYVDNSLAASDNTGVSWANAWTNFASIIWGNPGWKAGDTLYISGGTTSQTYNETLGPFNITSPGSPYSYIKTGTNAGHTGTVIIDGQGTSSSGISAVGNHRLIIDGSSGLGITNLVIKNFFDAANNSAGIGISYGGDSDGWIHHIEIYDCNVGIYNAGSASNSTISQCYIHNVRGNAGIQLNGASTKAWDTTFVSNVTVIVNFDTNQSPNTGADGIQGGNGITIHHCYFGTITGTNVQNQHPDACQLIGEFNKIYDCEMVDVVNAALEGGSSQTNSGNLMFYNNVIRRTSATTWLAFNRGVEWSPYPGPAPTSLTNVHIYNNTFVDLTNWNVVTFTYGNTDANNPTNQPTFADFNIKNNLFFNCTDSGHGAVIKLYPNTNAVSPNVTIDYNAMCPGAHGLTNITANGAEYIQNNPRTGTPAFISYSECGPLNNLHLSLSDSVAVDRGTSLATFFSTDKDGVTRPQGLAWDIGAYEAGHANIMTGGTVLRNAVLQ